MAVLASVLTGCGGGGDGESALPGGEAPPPAPPPVEAPAPPPVEAPAPPPPVTPPAPPPVTPPAPPPAAASFSITSVSPAAATGVPRTSEISVSFSHALRPETVTPANLALARAGTAVPGLLSYDAARWKVGFAPQQPLDLLASYTVTAGTGIRDLAGRRLEAERSWTFRTADGSWQASHRLEPASADGSEPRIAVDAAGHAVAVWAGKGGSGEHEVKSASYAPDRGWGSAVTVSSAGESGGVPRIALDAQGNGLALWVQRGSVGSLPSRVWSARYVKGQGWQPPLVVDTHADGLPRSLSLAMGPAGDAFAVWTWPVDAAGLSTDDAVWGARFTPAGGWEAPTQLGTTNHRQLGKEQLSQPPPVAVDAAGNAHVLWILHGGTGRGWSARYLAGSGWRPATALVGVPAGDPGWPQLAVSGTGQALALWTLRDAGGRQAVWSSLLASPSGTWSPSVLLDGQHASYPRQAVADGGGNFHALWERYPDVPGGSCMVSSVHYARYTPGQGWGAAAEVGEGPACELQGEGDLVADRNGNVMVVWGTMLLDYAGGNSRIGVLARRHDAVEGWKPIVTVHARQPGEGARSSLAAWPDGSIAAISMLAPGGFGGAIHVDMLK